MITLFLGRDTRMSVLYPGAPDQKSVFSLNVDLTEIAVIAGCVEDNPEFAAVSAPANLIS